MNALTKTEPAEPRSITRDMAHRYGMEPMPFERTLRATVFPGNGTVEEFAAFLLVAKEYGLNPVTKEIYAFPKRGGGIVPIVGIDGWCNLVNSNPAFDGMDFVETHDENGKLVSTTCKIYRKDRSHPVSVTEYLTECVRPTDPWKMQHRMLRHKAMIQCARYAFALSGIYDEDEAEKIIETSAKEASRNYSPPPPPPAEPVRTIQPPAMVIDVMPPAPPTAVPVAGSAQAFVEEAQKHFPGATVEKGSEAFVFDPEAIRSKWTEAAKKAASIDALNDAWTATVGPHEDALFPPDHEDLVSIYRRREHELEE